MTGTEANAFEVKRNMDRLPDFLDPEKQLTLSGKCTEELSAGLRPGWQEGWRRSRYSKIAGYCLMTLGLESPMTDGAFAALQSGVPLQRGYIVEWLRSTHVQETLVQPECPCRS